MKKFKNRRVVNTQAEREAIASEINSNKVNIDRTIFAKSEKEKERTNAIKRKFKSFNKKSSKYISEQAKAYNVVDYFKNCKSVRLGNVTLSTI